MEIAEYLKIIRRYWWLVLLTTLAAGVGVIIVDLISKPQYSGYTRVLVRPSPKLDDSRTVVDLIGTLGARYVVGTYAQVFTSDAVKAAARKSAGLSISEADLYSLDANPLPDTLVVEINGKGPDPNLLALYLDAIVTAGLTSTNALFGEGITEVTQLEPARVPAAPTSPQPLRDVSLALMLGLALGILLAWAAAYLRLPSQTSDRFDEARLKDEIIPNSKIAEAATGRQRASTSRQ